MGRGGGKPPDLLAGSIAGAYMAAYRVATIGGEFERAASLPRRRAAHALGDRHRLVDGAFRRTLEVYDRGAGRTGQRDDVATLRQDAEIETAVASGGTGGDAAAGVASKLDIDAFERRSGEQRRGHRCEGNQRQNGAEHRLSPLLHGQRRDGGRNRAAAG
jgi:hypothetical protein